MLLVFGLGYVGAAVVAAARAAGHDAVGTVRREAGPAQVRFDVAGPSLARATHLLSTVPPDAGGDPVLSRYCEAIAAAPDLRWIGYLSTTGVYGDRGGAWVTEQTVPAPCSERSRRRLAAEREWAHLARDRAVDLFRLAAIYGPGRSALDQVRGGQARCIIRPAHIFGRIHLHDIVQAVLAAIAQERQGLRVLNLADDEPAEPAAVLAEAARLLGCDTPPPVEFDQAWKTMRATARSFWAENRRVSSAASKAALGIAWRYPSYREGLPAILAEECREGIAQQSQVGRA